MQGTKWLGRLVVVQSLLALVFHLSLAAGPAVAQTSGTWTVTSQMANSEENATATLLQNGTVLSAGGDLGGIGVGIKNAQIYGPAANVWKKTGNMNVVRYGHSSTLLPNGQVLIAGGGNATYPNFNVLSTAELYDPTTGTFTQTGKMSIGHYGHTATLLPNGRVLVTGGMFVYWLRNRRGACTNAAELYDPASTTWSSAGSMSTVRCGATATLLPSGKVLVAGGGSSDLYDPATNSWSPSGAMVGNRAGHSAVLLQTGKVLIAGPDTTAELYDPATGTWSATGGQLYSHPYVTMVLLANGKALLAGNNTAGNCELYDPFAGTWSPTGNLNHQRSNFPVTLLSDGRVLVVGGLYDWWSGEIYQP